ncbi:TRAG family protein [Desulfofundulus kuznetsovii DSM 6115]|uniref:TRAG family protein n=1 Tax=Desulfofundulus kuznetsovii (strain DSM 6115 / VKM B-1805 / 17) TaxID=760568 RepID=A0AAU8PB36_DESK7|nr:TRAG family protein [Desulfofundulus kuznetsovii DSM 6115]
MNKVKIATFAVIGLAGLALVAALPVGVLVGAAAFGAYRYSRRTAAALFPLALGVGLALAFWYAADLINTLKHLGGTKPAVPLDIAGWMTMDRLDPANRMARVGLILGTLGGVVLALARGRGGELHDERHVHGLRVADSAAKGTRRWAGDRDIAHICEFGPPKKDDKFGGGIVLGRLKGRIVRAQPALKGKPPLPGHVMVAAGTGAGKTYSFVVPNAIAAACAGESIVLTDPKGELTCLLAPWLKSQGYDVYVFNLQYPEWGDRWNPVLECRDDEEITAFAMAIVHNAAKDSSGYFVMKEIQLLKALVYLLRADFPPEQAHLRSVLSLLAWPIEALDERFQNAYRAGRLPREGLEEWRGAVSSNIDNAVSGLTAKLGVIRAEPVAKLLAGVPGQMIDLSVLGRKKAALFCVLPVNSGHLKPVLATFYYFFFRRLYGLAAEYGGKLPNPTRFLLDEFANIGQVPGFTEIISTARSLGIYVQFILQSVKQLADVYGANELEVITGNCPVRLFLGGDDRTTTTYFSQQLGEAAVYSVSESKDVTMPWDRLDVAKRRETVVRRALMEPEELAGMDSMAAVCLMRWCLPLYLTKLGWEELPQAKEIKELAASTLADVAPKKDFRLELPEMPEIEEAPKPDRDRKRGGEKKGSRTDTADTGGDEDRDWLDDLFGPAQ